MASIFNFYSKNDSAPLLYELSSEKRKEKFDVRNKYCASWVVIMDIVVLIYKNII
jgi:hypothetical protein